MNSVFEKNLNITKHKSFNPADKSLVIMEFDRVANDYEINRLASWYKAHSEIILRFLNENITGTVLDIGCGTGWLLRQLTKTKNHINGIGIDISGNMIAAAQRKAEKEKNEKVEFIHDDWESMDISYLSKKYVTTIICANAFHYFNDPLLASRKMHKVLRKDGRVIMFERDKSRSPITILWHFIHNFIINDHVRFYFAQELFDLLDGAGFSDVVLSKRIKKLFWKKKINTAAVLMTGYKR